MIFSVNLVGDCLCEVTVMSYDGNVPSLNAVLPMPWRTIVMADPAVLIEYVPLGLFINDVDAKLPRPAASAVSPTNEFPPPRVTGLA